MRKEAADWPTPEGWDPSEGLLISQEVAELYRVHPHVVSRWARTRLIPAILTPGGEWRFSVKWVRENRAPREQ